MMPKHAEAVPVTRVTGPQSSLTRSWTSQVAHGINVRTGWGYYMMPLSSVSHSSFPPDLFYSHIIPDILSEHLHLVLVEGVVPGWHPFYTLPLVSQAFHGMCKMMCRNIFGLEEDESPEKITFILGQARKFWAQARLPPGSGPPIINPHTEQPYAYAPLMSSKSLIQVYICTAIAHSFFRFDVQYGLELEVQDLRDADPDLMDPSWEGRPRRFQMRDDTMHRVYLPLTCAMKLCDYIRPARLAYIIAKHLADIVPRYSTEPVLLKYTQDLETYITRQHRVDMNTWVEWTSRTLGLIEDTQNLLKKMQRMGKLVKAFKKTSSIPREVLIETNIIPALHDVMLMDWGPDTDIISGRAADLLEEWDPTE